MRLLGPTSNARLNEACAVVFLAIGLFLLISLVSYQPFDPSLNAVSFAAKPANLTGRVGAYTSDFTLQVFGLAAYAIPALILLLGWKWIQSLAIEAPLARVLGAVMMLGSTCAMLGFASGWHPIAGIIPAGGLAGLVLAEALTESMNLTGAVMLAVTCWILGLYLISTFEMAVLQRTLGWLMAGPRAAARAVSTRLISWRQQRALAAKARAEKRALKQAMQMHEAQIHEDETDAGALAEAEPASFWKKAFAARAAASAPETAAAPTVDAPPFDPNVIAETIPAEVPIDDIPIHALDYTVPQERAEPEPWEAAALAKHEDAEAAQAASKRGRKVAERALRRSNAFRIPPTELLAEVPERSVFDTD